MDVLDLPNSGENRWTLGRNAEWVQSGIDNGQTFRLASDPVPTNLVKTSGSRIGQDTVTAMEIRQIQNSGLYEWSGSNLLTPNGLHPFSQIDPSMAGVGALSNFFLGDSNLSLGGAQSALGGGSANGGFVLYPSTPNLNGVTSAYGK